MRNALVVLLLLTALLSSTARQSHSPLIRPTRNSDYKKLLEEICRDSALLYFSLINGNPLFVGWQTDVLDLPKNTSYDVKIDRYFWSKPVTTPENSICHPMNTTCCRPNAEKYMAKVAQREYGELFLAVTRNTLQDCFVFGRKLYIAMQQNFREMERRMMIHINTELDNKLPVDFFEDFFDYLQTVLFHADLCQLPLQLRTVMTKMFDFVYDTQQGSNLRSTHQTCYKNVSEQIMEPFYEELFKGLERQLYNLDLIFKAMKLSEALVDKIKNFRISSECIKPFTQLRYCTRCTGYSDFKPCLHFCLNVFRGCFADIGDLHQDYKLMKQSMRDIPTDMLPMFQPNEFIRSNLQYFVDLARDLGSRELRAEVQEACSGHGGATVKKRSASRYVRTATPFIEDTSPTDREFESDQLLDSFEAEMECMESLSSLLDTIPEGMCYLPSSTYTTIADTGNHMCWTGDNLGTYHKPLVAANKEAQVDNPVFENTTLPFSSEFDDIKMDIRLLEAELNSTLEDMPCVDSEDCMASPFYICEAPPDTNVTDDNIDEFSGSGSIEDSFADMEIPSSPSQPDKPPSNDDINGPKPSPTPYIEDDEDFTPPEVYDIPKKDENTTTNPYDIDKESDVDKESEEKETETETEMGGFDKSDFDEWKNPVVRSQTGGSVLLQCSSSWNVILLLACLLLAVV